MDAALQAGTEQGSAAGSQGRIHWLRQGTAVLPTANDGPISKCIRV